MGEVFLMNNGGGANVKGTVIDCYVNKSTEEFPPGTYVNCPLSSNGSTLHYCYKEQLSVVSACDARTYVGVCKINSTRILVEHNGSISLIQKNPEGWVNLSTVNVSDVGYKITMVLATSNKAIIAYHDSADGCIYSGILKIGSSNITLSNVSSVGVAGKAASSDVCMLLCDSSRVLIAFHNLGDTYETTCYYEMRLMYIGENDLSELSSYSTASNREFDSDSPRMRASGIKMTNNTYIVQFITYCNDGYVARSIYYKVTLDGNTLSIGEEQAEGCHNKYDKKYDIHYPISFYKVNNTDAVVFRAVGPHISWEYIAVTDNGIKLHNGDYIHCPWYVRVSTGTSAPKVISYDGRNFLCMMHGDGSTLYEIIIDDDSKTISSKNTNGSYTTGKHNEPYFYNVQSINDSKLGSGYIEPDIRIMIYAPGVGTLNIYDVEIEGYDCKHWVKPAEISNNGRILGIAKTKGVPGKVIKVIRIPDSIPEFES